MPQESERMAANVIVMNGEGKVLVMHRGETAPVRPLTWDFPGGEVQPGEDPLKAAVRETLEETGLEVKTVEPVLAFSHPRADVRFFIYMTNVDTPEVRLSYEHDRYAWVSVAEALELEMPKRFKAALERLAAAQ